jgi:hypothetical protein
LNREDVVLELPDVNLVITEDASEGLAHIYFYLRHASIAQMPEVQLSASVAVIGDEGQDEGENTRRLYVLLPRACDVEKAVDAIVDADNWLHVVYTMLKD